MKHPTIRENYNGGTELQSLTESLRLALFPLFLRFYFLPDAGRRNPDPMDPLLRSVILLYTSIRNP